MATVPLSGTDIRLLSGVPFSSDYKHTRWFDGVSEQTNYFLNKPLVHAMHQANFQRVEGYHFIAVNASIDELWGTNYLMFQNAIHGMGWWYGFVTKLEYVQKNTTYVHFEIDVLQTWMFFMQFKPSFVVREHCPLWYGDGSPVNNTIDEGLNYGTEYNIVGVENYRPCDDVYFLVVAAKQGMHGTLNQSYYASLNGLPQLMVYYIHPFKLNGDIPGCSLGTLSSIGDFLGAVYTQTNAVNNVVSIYVTDALPNNPTNTNGTLSFDPNNYQLVTLSQQLNGASISTIFVSDMDYGSWIYDAGDKYTDYTMPTESKLLMYPYTLVELVDMRGNKATFKNEYIDNSNLLLSIHASLGLNNKIVYSLKDYNSGRLTDDTIKDKINLENGLINNDPNDLPIMTDLLSAYLQGNRNTIQNQKDTIMFNGVMGAINGGVNTAMGAAMMGPMGAVHEAGETIQGAGNSVLAMQGINAKIKDIGNIPPNLSKMGSNSYFDYGNKLTGVWIIKKEITDEYRTKLSDFFNMFGYKLNEVKIPNFHTRQSWNYVQTKSCMITGNFNNNDLQELKNIFDSGITLWHTDDIGNYSLGNGVI